MDRFESMTAFTTVVETGSFARAARRLDISVSAVSRHVSELEAHLGVRLLNRTTRRLSMTEGGQAFHERCVQLLADLDEAEQGVTAAAVVPSGTLRITSSISFGAGYLAPAIAGFRQRHPQVRFDIALSDRAVDLVDERIDLAIRIGGIGSQALISRRIGGARMVCCASPGYLARNPAPRTPADLARHTCLTYEYSADGNVWRFADAAQRAYDVAVAGVAHSNNGAMLAALAVAGLGITRARFHRRSGWSRRTPRPAAHRLCAGGDQHQRRLPEPQAPVGESAVVHRLPRRALRAHARVARRGRRAGEARAQAAAAVALQGIWIFPPPGSAPPGPSVAPAGGSTIDDDAWRRISWISRIARSTPAFVASG